MNPIEIIQKLIKPNTIAYDILIQHSELVKQKSIKIAEKVSHLNPDINFISEAALLHDIGIHFVHAPGIDCHGSKPYILHGCLGKNYLESLGFVKHARVCECHVGVGITVKDIIKKKLPLPQREMVPKSIEEQIICYADKFYSKNPSSIGKEKSLSCVLKEMAEYPYDKRAVEKFSYWVSIFEKGKDNH